MKPKNHQEKQQELEQVFQQKEPNNKITNNKEKIKTQSELVEISGMLFETESKYSEQINTTPTFQDQTMQIPIELQQVQYAVQQAHQTLLNESQQLQQALYQLHQAQERVRYCQGQVQQAQMQVQSAQTTASAFLNNLSK